MKIVRLPEVNVNEFLSSLDAFGELHAPLKKGEKSFAFDKVKAVEDIEFECTRTILPPKKYFMPPQQTMFNFSNEKGYPHMRAVAAALQMWRDRRKHWND